MDYSIRDISLSYVRNLATIYRNIKKQELNTKDKIRLYINLENGMIIVAHKNEAKSLRGEGYSRLDNKVFKRIFKDFNAQGLDTKIQREAAKALLFIPWKYKFEENFIFSTFPAIKESSSQLKMKKVETLDKMLNEIETFNRSHEGGNGVFIFSCKPLDQDNFFPEGRVVIKFMKKEAGERAAFGDRFLKEMGFTTPGSKCLPRSENTGMKIVNLILDGLGEIKEELHGQIRKQTNEMDSILVMKHLPALTLRQIPEPDLLELLENEQFLLKLGEMVFFDAFIGNVDRLSDRACNLGNMMVNKDSSLVLLDHEFCLSSWTKGSASPLIQLLCGEKTEAILLNLQGALNFDRKEMGGIKLEPNKLAFLKPLIERGIHQGAARLRDILSNQSKAKRLFQFPSHMEQLESSCKLMEQLKKFIDLGKG